MFKHFKKLLFITPIITTISLPMVSLACTPQQQYIDAVDSWNKLSDQFETKVQKGEKQYYYLSIAMKNAASFYNKGNELAFQAGGHFSANQYFQLVAQIEAKKKYVELMAQALAKDPKMYNAQTLDIISLYKLIYTNNSSDSSLGSMDSLGKKIFDIWESGNDSAGLVSDIVQASKTYKSNLETISNIWDSISAYLYVKENAEIQSQIKTFKQLISSPMQASEAKWDKIDLASDLLNNVSDSYHFAIASLNNLFNNSDFINSLNPEQKEQVKLYQDNIAKMENNARLAYLQATLVSNLNQIFKDIYLKILYTFYQTDKFDAILSTSTYNKIITTLVKSYEAYLTLSIALNNNQVDSETIKKVDEFKVITSQEYSEINDKIKEYLTNNISKD
ncbi:hypothetical protein ACNQ2K_00780 [Mycoplasma sp. VS292A]|uniref:hypothetical protein n=1 Tax=Mycoplasma sp. VS292A TaxID=3401680 RepID=UPI003AAD3CC2